MLKLLHPFSRLNGVTRRMSVVTSLLLLGSLFMLGASATSPPMPENQRPTIVLVHGAFAESASWNGVARQLSKDGFRVIAAANPLRSVHGDAAYIGSVIRAVDGPVVLVGHSYGGSVISAAAAGNKQVTALVYVAAFAPEKGETAVELSGRFPGGTLGSALAAPAVLENGGKDLSIRQDRFHAQFAADVPAAEATLMAITQRPITEAALGEASDEPAWKGTPAWFVFGTADKNIPVAAHRFMAQRASSRKTVEVRGASHVVMVSNPKTVAKLIAEAATLTD